MVKVKGKESNGEWQEGGPLNTQPFKTRHYMGRYALCVWQLLRCVCLEDSNQHTKFEKNPDFFYPNNPTLTLNLLHFPLAYEVSM